MPMTDYEIIKLEGGFATGKIENPEARPTPDFQRSENVAGGIETEDYRLTVTPATRLHDDGPGRYKCTLKIQLSRAQRGKGSGGRVYIPDLQVRFSIDGTKIGNDEDFSGGERQHELRGLQIGVNRLQVELVGYFSLITDLSIVNNAKPIPIRLTIEPGGLEEVSQNVCRSDIAIRLMNTDLSKLALIPDLKVILKVNNVDVSGEQDLSSGQLNYTLTNLVPGYSRITAELVGRGLSASGLIQFARKALSLLPTKTDSYATGTDSIRTQVEPAKASYPVTYTRDDSNWTRTVNTDQYGMAICSGIIITKPTFFTIVAPTSTISEPERICVVPPLVGMPKWAKKFFLLSAAAFVLVIACLVLYASFGPEGAQITVITSAPIDPELAREIQARNHYMTPLPTQQTTSSTAIGNRISLNILWWMFGISFCFVFGSTVTCLWKAIFAGIRNWKNRGQEDRMGRTPQQVSPPVTAGATALQSSTSPVSKGITEQAWAIIREIIAEAFVDASARGIRSFKMPKMFGGAGMP